MKFSTIIVHTWKLFFFPSILLHSTPGPLLKPIIASDVLTVGSEQHLGKVSELQKQSKHSVFPWQDAVNSAVKEKTTRHKESLKQNDRYKELEDDSKVGYYSTECKKIEKKAPNVGLEPTTLRLRVSCSTD